MLRLAIDMDQGEEKSARYYYSIRLESVMFVPSPVETFPSLNSVMVAYCNWVRKRKLIRQCRLRLNECDSYEVARIAKEVGLSPSELCSMARLGPDAARLLLDRMTALSLDAEVVAKNEPSTMRDLQRLCSSCESKKRCKHDLERDDPDWRQYCPNSGTLAALQS
jgi:hypothetical protein